MGTYPDLSSAIAAIQRAARAIADDPAPLEEMSSKTLTNLKKRHGVYGPGWPKLKAATIAAKGGDSPRLDTGAHSIGSYSKSVGADEANIGTNDQIEQFQELGTIHIPARPIFKPEADDAATYAPEIAGKHVVKHLRTL